jgi:alpha-glucosidase
MNKIVENKLSSGLNEDPNWWRGGVIYQVYPRSYQDTDSSGTGDLKGITQRLDHIASMGVDAVWISPFFTSPMKDYGYDVSDYCDIDPMFGSLADFDALIARAHSLGLRIMIDLVLSHTSDQHAWFEQSRQSRDNPFADWYVWADPKEDGTPPNNWLSIFGGSAWQWDTRRQQYYLHNFLSSQPDLNLHNMDVQDALLDVERFWLERGVDGFRLDTINFYFADKLLRDNPPLPKNERDFSIAPAVNPYSHQLHIHSKNQPENIDFLRRFRAVSDEYPNIATVGEVGDAQRGLEIAGEYTAGDDLVQMCYAFEFLSGADLTANRIVETFERFDKASTDGWACWAFSNHDVVRHATRWSLDDTSARCYATLLMTWRGSSCIYQGEELGLPEAKLDYEDLRDPYGIEFWPEMPSRDGCRTPMAWQGSEEHGGFSKAKPWLPVPSEHLALNVEDQNAKNDALIHHYRRVIAMRTGSEVLRQGDQVNMHHEDDVLMFERQLNGDRVVTAFNLSANAADISLPEGTWTMLDVEVGAVDPNGANKVTLPAWGYVLLSQVG